MNDDVQKVDRLTAPVLLVIVARRQKAAARDSSQGPGDGVEDGVAHDTSDQAVCDRVRERHEHERDESRDGVARVVPVDRCHSAHHHATDEDQGSTSCPGWDGSKDWRKEERDKKADSGGHGCQTSPTALLNTRAGLDKSCDG